ncbi:MAG TPA: hypothetical protein DDY27_15975 [Hyphomonadaceae bacterium]|nr:hypothetical protein [Hyphomonadaceae bacterium]
MAKQSKPKGEVFEGRSAEMKESPWLASEDILDAGDVKVKIVRCHRYKDVQFDAGRKEPTVYALEFEGKSKQLVLNSVNRKTLVAKFGTDVRKWSGQEVCLWVDRNVRFAGRTVNGVRIK